MGLIFDGIDLKTNYNFVVTNINGRGSPPVSRTMLELPRIDGAIELNSKLQSRNITIRGYVYGTDASIKKDALIKLITQAYSQEKKLTFPDTNRSIYVKLAGEPIVLGPVGPVLNAQAYELTFNFVAQDPYFYGEDHDESGFRIVKINAYAPTYLISPRRKFLKREAAFKIEPYTIVNLLGKYGNFETYSNGVADRWDGFNGSTLSIVDGIIGVKAQKAYFSNSGGVETKYPGISFNWDWYLFINPEHKYFWSYYAKLESENTTTNQKLTIRFYGYDNELTNVENQYLTRTISSSWTHCFGTNTTGSNTTKIRLAIYGTCQIDEISSFVVDGVMIVDLTAMGTLPYGLQQYFGLQKWEDLATPNDIEAIDKRAQSGEDWLAELLPYTDSVATLGWHWEAV